MLWLICLCGLFAAVIIILLIKIYLMKKSAREIKNGFAERLTVDTNTLIGISSGDKDMRGLAESLNEQLRQLRSERRRFRQGDRELKNAVTNISHDLRTPLTAICGYLDLLEKEEKSDEVSRCLDIIANRTEILKQLTEELFRYSVIIAEKDEFTMETVVINDVLGESVAGAYADLTERGIVPEIRMTESRVERRLNRNALSRIFSNLIGNAVKYSDGDLEITLSESGEITFANTARGLNEVQVGRMFDRFYTVESARNSTGLGLSIAKTLAEQMNGTIRADYTDEKLRIVIKF